MDMIIKYSGKDSEIYIERYMYNSIIAVHPKLTQCCKSTTSIKQILIEAFVLFVFIRLLL